MASLRHVTAANELWDDSIEFTELGILVLDRRHGAVVQRHQHEQLQHTQTQQLLFLFRSSSTSARQCQVINSSDQGCELSQSPLESGFWPTVGHRLQATPWLYTGPSSMQFQLVYSCCQSCYLAITTTAVFWRKKHINRSFRYACLCLWNQLHIRE